MVSLPTSPRLAKPGTRPELKPAFAALAAVVAPAGDEPSGDGPPGHDEEVATEALWAVLQGLAELERTGRIRPGARDLRRARVVVREPWPPDPDAGRPVRLPGFDFHGSGG